jgi:ankyrin repeat protein
MYTAEETQSNAEEERILRRLIDSILKNDSYAFNATDINKDTALNISCEFKCLNWVTRELLLKKDIDINVINDVERSALTTAIEQKNIEAIRMLSKMRGLVVRDIDRKAAKEADIDLSEYGL